MKRTVKNGDIIFDGIHTRAELERRAFVELEELQDIQEKLGVDLITLFKAFNHIYYKKDNEIKMACHIALVDWAICILDENMTIGEGVSLRVYDYGKTWALTKEELEK